MPISIIRDKFSIQFEFYGLSAKIPTMKIVGHVEIDAKALMLDPEEKFLLVRVV
jgi:hypothetical protein